MTGTNCKNHWSWRLISPSLTLCISCQSSFPITVPVHSQSVNRTPNYLIPILLFFKSFAPQCLYLHITIYTSITPVLMLNCNYFSTTAYLLLYLPNLTTFAHTVYRFSIVLLTVRLFIPCVTLCCFCRTALLYLVQVAVVNENWPTWLKTASILMENTISVHIQTVISTALLYIIILSYLVKVGLWVL